MAADTRPTLIQNPGFESGTEGWSVHAYGARPAIEPDTSACHEGKQSLRISTTDLSDTALAQEVHLRPNQCYRFTGWARTQGLDPHGAPVCGTYQIQHGDGKGIIASGANHQGDTDWARVTIYFESPPDGRARVAVFLVGFGKGTGTAWFDDLRLEEVDPVTIPLRITRAPLCPGTIHLGQYGQFIEYLCDLVPGMWAEKVYDGGFEGLTPYKFAYLRETDFRERPWYPTGATNRAEYTRDQTGPVSGEAAQKIAVTGAAPCAVGIAQDGIAVELDRPLQFHCYLRQQGITGPVSVRLHREGNLLAVSELRPGEKWQHFSARLMPTRTETNATLSITFRGPGTLWLDNVSLMPEDTVGGWRRDVVEAVRALRPGVIRFGGSALDEPGYGEFDWRDTIGDSVRRKVLRAWGGLQPAAAGLEEIVQFCHHVQAEPLLCVRVAGRTPKDAAEEVQYFNGAGDSAMGRLRARNGHPEPYRIKYWQVGNERAGKEYEERLAAFCKAMKEADPTIELFSSYPSPGVLQSAGDFLDYVCPHHYDCANLAAMENDIGRIAAMIREHAPGRKVKIAVTEWNTTAGDWGPRRAMLWTLANALACSRYHNLLHRHCDTVAIANRSNLTNSFCSGIIQTDNHRLYKTPTYYAQQLYATLAGDRPLKIESALPANMAPDCSATLSPKGDAVVLFAVNATTADVTRPLDLSAFGAGGQEVEVWTVADTERAGEPDVTNSFANPERVHTVKSHFNAGGPRFDHRFPALSITVLRWRVPR
jgi:alpha-N-arabinofuranosidase